MNEHKNGTLTVIESPEARDITVVIPPSRNLAEQVSPLERYAKELNVDSQLTYDNATAKLREIKRLADQVDKVFDPVVEAGHQAHKTALAAKAVFSKPLETARKTITEKAGNWIQEEQRKTNEEKRKLEKVAEEKAEQERNAKLAEAKKALKKGDAGKASDLLDAAEAVRPEPVLTIPPVTKSYGVSPRGNWSAEVVELDKVPREYLIADMVKLNALARAMKDEKAAPPGVRFKQSTGFNVR